MPQQRVFQKPKQEENTVSCTRLKISPVKLDHLLRRKITPHTETREGWETFLFFIFFFWCMCSHVRTIQSTINSVNKHTLEETVGGSYTVFKTVAQ